MIEFVVTDLDGTLWQGDGLMPSSTRRAIEELERRDIPLLAATARRSFSALSFFARLQLDLPVVLLNGALGRRRSSGQIFHERAFDSADAIAVLEVFERHGVRPSVNFESEEWDVVSGLTPSAGRPYLDYVATQLKRVDDLSAMCVSLPVYGFSVVASEEVEPLQSVKRDLTMPHGLAEVVLTPDAHFGGWTMEVSPLGITKWNGVEAFADAHGLDVTRSLAIGDGDNDVELLERAARSLAMSHATERAKLAATVVLSGGIEGWERLLEYL